MATTQAQAEVSLPILEVGKLGTDDIPELEETCSHCGQKSKMPLYRYSGSSDPSRPKTVVHIYFQCEHCVGETYREYEVDDFDGFWGRWEQALEVRGIDFHIWA